MRARNAIALAGASVAFWPAMFLGLAVEAEQPLQPHHTELTALRLHAIGQPVVAQESARSPHAVPEDGTETFVLVGAATGLMCAAAVAVVYSSDKDEARRTLELQEAAISDSDPIPV